MALDLEVPVERMSTSVYLAMGTRSSWLYRGYNDEALVRIDRATGVDKSGKACEVCHT